MCEGFSAIVLKNGLIVYFSLPDRSGDMSHSDILRALKINEVANPFLRPWVKIECRDWTMKTFNFDDMLTLPGWVEENQEEIKSKVEKVMGRAEPILRHFQTAVAEIWEQYRRACEPAQKRETRSINSLYETWITERKQARKSKDPIAGLEAADETYNRKTKAVQKTYWEATRLMGARRDQTIRAAQEVMIEAMRQIEGFVYEPIKAH